MKTQWYVSYDKQSPMYAFKYLNRESFGGDHDAAVIFAKRKQVKGNRVKIWSRTDEQPEPIKDYKDSMVEDDKLTMMFLIGAFVVVLATISIIFAPLWLY